MLNDKQLELLSYEIDDLLTMIAHKHQVGPLSLSSIMLARLMRMVMETGDLDDLRSIMIQAINIDTNDGTADNRILQ